MSAPARHRCGDEGGISRNGQPCGLITKEGTRCQYHRGTPEEQPLTALQRRFVEEYIVDLNGTAAALRAGYNCNPDSARNIASENLAKPNIARALAEAQARIASHLEVTAERTLREVSRIAFSDLRRLVAWNGQTTRFLDSEELSDDDAATVQAVKAKHTILVDEEGRERHTHELELRTYDKLNALQKLIKNLGLEADIRSHVTVDVNDVAQLTDEQLVRRTLDLAGRLPKEAIEAAFRGRGNGHRGNGAGGNGGKP